MGEGRVHSDPQQRVREQRPLSGRFPYITDMRRVFLIRQYPTSRAHYVQGDLGLIAFLEKTDLASPQCQSQGKSVAVTYSMNHRREYADLICSTREA